MVTGYTKKHGFSLVELSVVIVIIALVIGGVIAGRELVRQAELQSVISEYEELNGGTGTFFDKYGLLPGDFDDANNQWGCGADCNGDGDGRVTWCQEALNAWVHLNEADIVLNSFDVTTGCPGTASVGINSPTSQVTSAGWSFYSVTPWGSTYSSQTEDHYFLIGREGTDDSGNSTTAAAFVTTEEAFAMDRKLDDGTPNTGNFVGGAAPSTVDDCVDSSGDSYNLDNPGEHCAFYMKAVF